VFEDLVTDAQFSDRLGKGGAKHHRKILRDNIQSTQMCLRTWSLTHSYQTDLEKVELNTTARFFVITSKVLKIQSLTHSYQRDLERVQLNTTKRFF
jgi:hypothetical protein